ncbi:hypothetical protein VULLAG_LOCUS13036 [Vulpes lagopus]
MPPPPSGRAGPTRSGRKQRPGASRVKKLRPRKVLAAVVISCDYIYLVGPDSRTLAAREGTKFLLMNQQMNFIDISRQTYKLSYAIVYYREL